MKMYGPYARKDGRKHLVLIKDDGTKTTISYPKWLMQNYLGRSLTDDETVDHIDGDVSNNELNNLQILSRRDNAIKSAKYADYLILTCICCGSLFQRRKAIHNRNITIRKVTGPFCSKQCVGKTHH